MEDAEKQYLEQNIQIALSQKELDIEDAIAIRQLKDVNQAERLLIVRRSKRIARNQEIAMQNSQMQAQVAQQSAQAASQSRQQEMQMEAQIKAQEMQLKNQLEIQLEQVKHEMRKEIEMIRAQATLGFRTEDQEFKQKLEVLKEDRKDERTDKEAVAQSKLISQRKGQRGELQEKMNINVNDIIG
jgi:cystathionine beta-lyase family protein involved in aluminum resistance